MAENGALRFKKIKNGHETYETSQKIEAEKIFYIPGDATHTGIYNGQIAFFISAWPTSYKGKKWRFFKIPEIPESKGERVDHLVFPNYKFGNSGHHYGHLEFFP